MSCGARCAGASRASHARLYGVNHFIVSQVMPGLGRESESRPGMRKIFADASVAATKQVLRGYLDFIQVLFLTSYLRRPLRLFGAVGTLLFLAGALICAYLTLLWLQGQRPIGDRPLLTLGVLTGMLWLRTVHGSVWFGTSHEVWTVVAWGIYAGLAIARFVGHQGGRQAAASAVAGFLFLLFAVVGVGVLA